MLHILLMILKILGIVVLSVLGLIFFVALVVLFVPIRYEITASRYDDTKAKIKVKWCLVVFRARFLYENSAFTKKIRLFGFDVVKFLEKRKGRKNKSDCNDIDDLLDESLEEDTYNNGNEDTSDNCVNENISSSNNVDNSNNNSKPTDTNNDTDTINIDSTINTENIDDYNLEKDSAKDIYNNDVNTNSDNNITNNITYNSKDNILTNSSVDKDLEGINIDNSFDNVNTNSIDDSLTNKNPTPKKKFCKFFSKKSSKFRKAKNTKNRKKLKNLKYIFKNMQLKIKRTKRKIKTFCKKLTNIKETITNILRFLASDQFKRNFTFAKEQFNKLFKHIMPTKHKVTLNFGAGSPDLTGKLLGGIAVFMAFTGININITPDFENEVFRGEVYLKGRIRLFNIVVIVFKTYFNKELRSVVNKIMNGGFKNGR